MDRHITWIVVGACFACLAVILGAFAAHGLKSKISTEDLAIFETGVRYQMYHSLGLILLGLIGFQTAQDIVFFPFNVHNRHNNIFKELSILYL